MRPVVLHLLVAAAITGAVGLLTHDGWPGYVVGAALALSLWVMLFAGSYAGSYAGSSTDRGRGRVETRHYLGAALFAIGLGWAMFQVGDGPTWWAVGFILAGAVMPATTAARDRERS